MGVERRILDDAARPEVICKPHEYAVVMPYSSNLKRDGSLYIRLSFYSAFITNVALEAYKRGDVKKLIIFDERTFGQFDPTGDLMRSAFSRRGVEFGDIVHLRVGNMNNTAYQIKELATFQKDEGLRGENFLVIAWAFHKKRIESHVRGFGVNGETVSCEELHKYYNPWFDLEKLRVLLPKDFENGERWLRSLSRVDKRGYILRLLTNFRGARVTDIRHTENGLVLEDTTGKTKIRERAVKKS